MSTYRMDLVQCSVDDCGHIAVVDVWTDCNRRAWLCNHHYYVTLVEPWVVFTVGGKELMRDTAGCWFYLPERDEALHALAVKAGVAK